MREKRAGAGGSGRERRRAWGAGAAVGALLVATGLACSARSSPSPAPVRSRPLPRSPALISTDTLAAWLARRVELRAVDVRPDVFLYLAGHVPDAVFLHRESLRAAESGLPTALLPPDWYGRLFSRLGIRWDRPVVVYSGGESLNIDATFFIWLLAGHGHP